MKKLIVIAILAVCAFALFSTKDAAAGPNSQSCWGQASAVFAQMGYMGEHSSSQATPRAGLANLARYLYNEEGAIAAPTLHALGAYVASELGLSISACL